MRTWVLAASLAAAAVAALPSGVLAADLDDGPPPYRRGAYDDPRYADIYRVPPPPPPPYVAPPPPRAPAYREDYEEEYAPPRRYSHSHCVPRDEIRHRLARAGWHDFHAADLRGEVATFHARRPSGRLFAVAVDRCSGEIVNVRPLEPRYGPGYGHGPYAHYGAPRPHAGYGYGQRRWERPYY